MEFKKPNNMLLLIHYFGEMQEFGILNDEFAEEGIVGDPIKSEENGEVMYSQFVYLQNVSPTTIDEYLYDLFEELDFKEGTRVDAFYTYFDDTVNPNVNSSSISVAYEKDLDNRTKLVKRRDHVFNF